MSDHYQCLNILFHCHASRRVYLYKRDWQTLFHLSFLKSLGKDLEFPYSPIFSVIQKNLEEKPCMFWNYMMAFCMGLKLHSQKVRIGKFPTSKVEKYLLNGHRTQTSKWESPIPPTWYFWHHTNKKEDICSLNFYTPFPVCFMILAFCTL